MESFDLEAYLTRGAEGIVKDALRATLSNPRQGAFLAKYLISSRRLARIRRAAEERGAHVPAFLIASVAARCNLHCAGCYARANLACVDADAPGQMTDAEWRDVFSQAAAMGVGFVLLAGGEPLLRRGVLEAAGEFPELLFPVFTNATLIDGDYADLFARLRNLVPILSVEGDARETDARRGGGVYDALMRAAESLRVRGVLFGASVTVTRKNIASVTSDAFVADLHTRGFKAAVYVDYVPVDGEDGLAPEDAERAYLAARLDEIRARETGMVFVAFPGDEKGSGGCLAAGRGFFHINAFGGAEPCPFSPYSDANVRETSLRAALDSPLFRRLRAGDLLLEDHAGGCVLFARQEQVRALLG